MTRINLTAVTNEESFSPEYRTLEFKSDVQLHDPYNDEITEYDFNVSSSSLTELYNKLYDISQSNDCFPSDAKIFIEDEPFAEMLGGIHLKLNEDFPVEIASKYMTVKEIDFITSNTLRKVYAEDEKVDGITLYRNDDLRAYNGYESGNHIKNKDNKKVFKNKEEVEDALKYYLTKDSKMDCIDNLDKTIVKLDGKDFATLMFGKEVKEKQEAPKQERRTKRKFN